MDIIPLTQPQARYLLLLLGNRSNCLASIKALLPERQRGAGVTAIKAAFRTLEKKANSG